MYLISVSHLIQFTSQQPSVERDVIQTRFSFLFGLPKLFPHQNFGKYLSFLQPISHNLIRKCFFSTKTLQQRYFIGRCKYFLYLYSQYSLVEYIWLRALLPSTASSSSSWGKYKSTFYLISLIYSTPLKLHTSQPLLQELTKEPPTLRVNSG